MTYFKFGEMDLFQSQLHACKLPKKADFAGALVVAGCILLGLSSVKAGPVLGDVRGVIRNAQGARLPGVRVLVHSVADNTDRNTVSNDQGVFLVANVKPGRYQLKASKEGLARSLMTTVNVAPQQDLRVVMTLAPLNASKAAGNRSLTADLHTPRATENAVKSPLTDQKLLLERLDRLEQRLEAAEAPLADQRLLLERLEERLVPSRRQYLPHPLCRV